jgi:hypothetical protein
MRDADLWDDFSIYLQKHTGWLGTIVLRIAELIAGPDMVLVHGNTRREALPARRPDERASKWDDDPSDEDVEKVRRELTENCVVSELLSSMIFLVMYATDIIFHHAGVEGKSLIAPKATMEGRKNAIAIYSVIMFFQVSSSKAPLLPM